MSNGVDVWWCCAVSGLRTRKHSGSASISGRGRYPCAVMATCCRNLDAYVMAGAAGWTEGRKDFMNETRPLRKKEEIIRKRKHVCVLNLSVF